MANTIDNTQLITLISEFFHIEKSEFGSTDDLFKIRCLGHLLSTDSESGFDQISNELTKYHLIATIRPLLDKQELIILPDPQKQRKPRLVLHFTMFLITLISVLITGGLYAFDGEMPTNTIQLITALIRSGWPFAISLLAILGAHEFGHYFAGRKHGINVTLPFFIPFPLSTFGTMGAFISMRSIPKNKKELFDLSVTGPLCGLIVSILVLFIGLNFSVLDTIPLAGENAVGIQMEGNSLLYLLMKYLAFGKWLPKPQDLTGISLIIFWARFFFTGMPFPWGAQDVMLHPVAWAGWAGLFITTINLIPAGQLDGGHIFQSVFGTKAMRYIFPIVLATLVTFGFFWAGWWTWAAILFFFGNRVAEPLDQVTKLDDKRRWLGLMMIIIFLITFIPVPLTIAGS